MNVEVIDRIISIFDENFYEYGSTTVVDAGLFTKHTIEGIIEEGETLKDGEQMPYGLFVSIIITFRKGDAHYFFCEFVDSKTGQIMNYIYESDYHLFIHEFDLILRNKGLPF